MGDHPSPVATTLATWVYQLHASGTDAAHEGIAVACRAVAEATDEAVGEAAGMALVAAVSEGLNAEDPAGVAAAAAEIYGERVSGALGEGDREERKARIRRYQFAAGLPWLARIWSRSDAGDVAPLWVIVERLTHEVTAMDPNPWDDVDEERHIPVDDFQVLWELDGCSCVAVNA